MSLSGRKPESQGELGAESEKQGSRARLRGEEESEPEMASCKKKKKNFFGRIDWFSAPLTAWLSPFWLLELIGF